MLDGLLQSVEGGDATLPFVRQFYGTPSQHLWEDDDGSVHIIHQGEGGEQGDPLMPMLFELGKHQALRSVQHFLRSDERLFAHLDDIYVVCCPERVFVIQARIEVDLWEFADPSSFGQDSGLEQRRALSSRMHSVASSSTSC